MLFLLACAATKPTVDAPVATDTAHVADTGAADSGGSPDDTAPDDTAGDTAPVHRWSGEYEAYRAAHGRISDVAGPWLAAGDLDGDGTADIVTGRSTSDGAGEAWAFHADAASAEDAFATVTGPEALGGGVPGDLDGDGLVDLVLAGAEGASLLPGPLGGTTKIDDAA
ncbi:MAG: FG-GAP repeat domain-containing protein, partial [Myxococcota bacterium]